MPSTFLLNISVHSQRIITNNILFKMNPKLPLLFLLLTTALALQLTASASANTTANTTLLSTLLQQQSTFESTINSLVANLHNISQQVNSTANTSAQILVLQHAITTERQKIAQLQQHIIPPFNLTRTACLQLTPVQQLNMMVEVNKAKIELAKLMNMTSAMPTNPEITQLTADIRQQETIVLGIESVIHSQCNNASVFSPTIFQSNLYASNWVLGRQSITNLIDQYYQRSLLYTSVNNCPLATPFFDGLSCIQCLPPTPIFDMQLSNCTNCPTGYRLHLTKHLCEVIPHYSNYQYGINYALGGAAALPPPPANVTACPSTHPFWNSTNCIKCALPQYWNVSSSQCLNCPSGLVFDSNLKNCTLPHNNTLTYLFGNSSWVTAPGNLSAVLAARAAIMAQTNATNYTVCSPATPYFDGVRCISCPQQFNLTSRLCVNASNGTVFDPNLHAYVPLQVNYSTNPNATNYIGNISLYSNLTNTTSCNASAPFFDGQACVNCSAVFPYFDLATNTCVQCSAYQYYDNISHSCVKRPILWISVNFTNIMASNNTTLASYKAMLYNMVLHNNQSIVQNCPPGQYSNFTHCFPCASPLYFDITNLTCAPCNGTLNASSLQCIHTVTFLTSPNASNLLLGNNMTIANYTSFLNTIVKPIAYCPSSKPYAVNGTKCIACNSSAPYFNVTNYTCLPCPSGLVYDPITRVCLKGVFVSNLAVLNHSNVIQNYTLNLTILQQMQIKNANGTPVVNCSASAPLFNGTHCMACPNGTWYMLSNFGCYTPLNVSNVTALAASNRYIQIGNNTLLSVQMAINASVYPVNACPSSAPLFNGTHCVACNSSEWYNLNNNTCYVPQFASNTTALNATNRYVNLGSYTLLNLANAISASPYPSIPCPSASPFYNGSQCINCPNGSYYDLKNNYCIVSRFASNVTALNATGKVIAYGQYNLTYLQAQINASVVPVTICPAATPFFNGTNCTVCPNGTYYLIETLSCYTPIYSSNVSALNATGRVIQLNNYTLANLNATIAAYPFPTKLCPSYAPFLSQGHCINCSINQWYDLQTRRCYTPLLATNVTELNLSGLYVNIGNYTLTAINASIYADPYPLQPCPRQAPLYNGSACMACPLGSYYLLSNFSCYFPMTVTNISYFYANNNYFDIGNASLFNIATAINASAYPVKACPGSAPLFNGTGCQACNSSSVYIFGPNNLTNQTSFCQLPVNITNLSALHRYYGNGSYSYFNTTLYLQNFSTLHKTYTCPSSAPLALNGTCVACNGSLFYVDLQNMTCVQAVKISNYTTLAGMKVIQNMNATMSVLESQQIAAAYGRPIVYCPSSAPLFNGTHCVACNSSEWYNLNNNTCYVPQLASNTIALNATNRYVNLGSFNLINLANSISASPYPSVPCPPTAPLFNGVQCVACPLHTYYDLKNLQCINSTYVSNVAALNATGKVVAVGQYNLTYLQAQITASMLPYKLCPSSAPLYNGTSCQACPNGTWYLIQTLTCYTPLHSSNVSALNATGRVLQLNNYTLANLNATIAAQPFPTTPCPSYAPFLSQGQCINCSIHQWYDLQTRRCYTPQLATNVSELLYSGNYIPIGNYTIANLIANYSSNPYPVHPCPTAAPIFNGSQCLACPPGTYYILSNFTCYHPPLVSNVSALNATGAVLTYNNVSLNTVKANITAYPYPVIECPTLYPLFNGSMCVACPNGTYYLLFNDTCYVPQLVSNLTTILFAGNYVNIANYTLVNMSAAIIAAKAILPVAYCPSSAPLFNGSQCIACPNGTYYLFLNLSCYSPHQSTNITEINRVGNYIVVGNYTIANITANLSAYPYPTIPCPAAAPLYVNNGCVLCPPGTYYILSNNTCYHPRVVSNINAINATGAVLTYNNVSLATVQAAIAAFPYPMAMCPALYPLFNGSQCVQCPNGTYYLLYNNTCYVPQFVTNYTQLNITGLYVNVGANTLASIRAAIVAAGLPVMYCPAKTPLFNGTFCIECKPGQYYNLGNLSCQNPNYISNTLALKLSGNYLQTTAYNLTTLQAYIAGVPAPIKQCSPSAPLFTGSACIVCSPPLIYDLANQKCASCASTYYFNTTLFQCVPSPQYYPNLNNTGWIVDNATGLQMLINMTNQRKLIPGAIMCPNSAPNYDYNTNTCGVCPAGQYWNYNNYTCMACWPGLSIDLTSRTCAMRIVGVYQTNINSSNLLYNGISPAQYQNTYNQNKLSYPGIKDCPPATPYFDGFNCIACNGTLPLFSMYHQLCSICPPNAPYSPTTFNCVASNGVVQSPPNIGKMYSSIF